MSKRFNSVLASRLGEFVKSPLGARETVIGGEFGYILQDWSFAEVQSSRYDSASDSWASRRGDNTTRGLQPGVFGLARSGGDVLGYRHGGQSQLLPREDDWKGMAEYTPTTDTWRSVHKTVFRHTYTASSSSVDNGFTMGGWSFERTIDPYLKDAEVYFPNVDVWASRTPFLQSSAHHAATGIIGRQYVTGGIGIINSGPSGAHFFYDEDTRTWNRLIFMALRRDSHAAVASFDMEYIIGGATRSRFIGVTNNVVRSNVRTDTWADVTSHPRSIMAFSSFNLSDGVYTAGGFGDEFMGFTPETYRLSNGAWVSRQAMLDGAASGPTDQGVKL